MGRFPAGVAVVTVDLDGQRLGLTVASLVSLSLDPPLIGVAVRLDAALHELLHEAGERSEEHTSELQSRENIVCRLLLDKKKQQSTLEIARLIASFIERAESTVDIA